MPTLRLPATFYDDHESRGLPSGVEVRRTRRDVYVDLTPAEVEEIRSDAAHYADGSMGYGADFPGLVSSARATLRRIDEASK